MTVTVVGLGKIGLPLAVQYAMKGEQVFGADINQKTVDCVNEGLEPFPGEEKLGDYLKEVIDAGTLKASTSTTDCVSKSDVVVIVVPLFMDLNANPEFTSLDSATVQIAESIKKGTLVIYETTLPIGTTRNRFTKMIEQISKLQVGTDFNVVFSPERVLTGRVFQDLRRYPKIVGGVTNSCTLAGQTFYNRVLDFDKREDLPKPNGVWAVVNSETAEFVKLAETTYRDVNIALANQFAIYATEIGVEIHDVIQSCNSQPYSNIHKPGIAVGGHCIPIYPQLYLWSDHDAELIKVARDINKKMPNLAISRIKKHIGDLAEKRVLILGASYRSNVKEVAFSGAYDLVKELINLKADVSVFDFLYSDQELKSLGLPTSCSMEEAEIVIIQNEDLRFIKLLEDEMNFPHLRLILDGRNMLGNAKIRSNITILSI